VSDTAHIARSRQSTYQQDYNELLRRKFTHEDIERSGLNVGIISVRYLQPVRREHFAWMLDDRLLMEFLLRRFPRMNEPAHRHRKRAVLWGYIIRRCFVSQWSAQRTAWSLEESGYCKGTVTPAYIRRVIQSIRAAMRGARLDGKPRSFGKAGRPRKAKTAFEEVVHRKSMEVEEVISQ